MTTFKELEKEENPTAEVLKATLKYYAEVGAAISGRVVIGIINRTTLSEGDKTELRQYAQMGVEMQQQVCDTRSSKTKFSGEFKQVLQHLK
jgi:hypothetical protein